MFKGSIAVAAIAAIAFLAIPTAANAAYGPDGTIVVSDDSPAAGSIVTVTFTDGSFDPNEEVNVIVDGQGDPTIAALAGAASVNKTASAAGGTSAAVGIPSNGGGTYKVTGTGATSGNILSATLTVAVSSDPDGVAYTGSTIPVLWIWVGGGALALGIAMVVILSITRRHQARR